MVIGQEFFEHFCELRRQLCIPPVSQKQNPSYLRQVEVCTGEVKEIWGGVAASVGFYRRPFFLVLFCCCVLWQAKLQWVNRAGGPTPVPLLHETVQVWQFSDPCGFLECFLFVLWRSGLAPPPWERPLEAGDSGHGSACSPLGLARSSAQAVGRRGGREEDKSLLSSRPSRGTGCGQPPHCGEVPPGTFHSDVGCVSIFSVFFFTYRTPWQ